MTLPAPQLLSLALGIPETSICSELALARRTHGADLRTDSADGGTAIAGARAQVRGYLDSVNSYAARLHGHKPASQERLDSLGRTLAEGLGYSHEDGDWRHDSIRTDSASFFRDEMTDRNGELLRPRQQQRVLSTLIPTRSVNAYAERFESRFLAHEGSVSLYRPGTTKVATVGHRVGSKRRDIHTFVTSTQTDWLAALQGSQSSVDHVAEDAYAVREVFADFHEELLVNGIGDQVSLWGLADLPMQRFIFAEDYEDGTATIKATYEAFISLLTKISEVHGFRGTPPDTLIIGPRFANALLPLNAIGSGGDMTASDLRMKLATLFDNGGIRRWIVAPSLAAFGGDPTQDAAILCRFDGQRGLHQIMAMTPAPVRSVESLTGSQTLWAMRHGGLDEGDATATALILATVA